MFEGEVCDAASETEGSTHRPPGNRPLRDIPASSGNSEPGLGGLRDEMLKELERLNKIMRGS